MDERGRGMRSEDERGYTLPRCRLALGSQRAEEVFAAAGATGQHLPHQAQ